MLGKHEYGSRGGASCTREQTRAGCGSSESWVFPSLAVAFTQNGCPAFVALDSEGHQDKP